MPRQELTEETKTRLRRRLLKWYEQCRRDLPWRQTTDSYAIWVSEIMLQQTRAAVVAERYAVFMARFPTLVALALGYEEEVLAIWSGLGYYRRARLLHKAARFVADHLKGNLPTSAEGLRTLPGIGNYTAAAIASIAYGERVAVVDGNVERVLCRLAGWGASNRKGAQAALRRRIGKLADALVDPREPGQFNQALMELGAMVCLPRNPKCGLCPIAASCATQGEHKTLTRPRMQSREVAHALVVRIGQHPGAANREVLLEQRTPTGTVMPGMWELPPLSDAVVPEEELRMTVRHAIMQVNYFVRIRTVFEDDVERLLPTKSATRQWVRLGDAAALPLTGLARKVLTRARLLAITPPRAIAATRLRDVP